MPDGDSSVAIPAATQALAVCPECQEAFPVSALDAHLRRAHRVYQHLGVRRSREDTVAALVDALLGSPSAETWQALSELALDEHGARAVAFLTGALARGLARLSAEQRSGAAAALGAVLAEARATHLIAALAEDEEAVARHLALCALARLPGPLGLPLIQALRALLLDRRLPAEAHLRAVAAVMHSPGRDGMMAEELLAKMVSGLGKARALERLRQLEELAGPSAAIDALREHLEDRLRMSCPRCEAELRRPQMVRHLWQEHRLVLDGRRVRDPWTLIEEWLDACRPHADPELLERCRRAAWRIDPEGGPARLRRLLLARGLADPDDVHAALAEARREHSACCPWCYALVRVPNEVPALELVQRPSWMSGSGRVSGRGYAVEIDEHGLQTRLEVSTPDRLLYRGREPGRRWTADGAALLLVGPIVLLALLAAACLPAGVGMPLGPVLVLQGIAFIVFLLVRQGWRWDDPPKLRVLEYAWGVLAPRLHRDGFVLSDSAFLVGLARASLEARVYPPGEQLRELVRRTEEAVAAGQGPPGHLALLRRLLVEVAAGQGEDPVPLVAQQLARCFQGRLPLTFAQHLLEDWASDWWTPGNLARLRVLLCDRAFEAGFEVRSLLDAGQNIPALGVVLRTDRAEDLAALRLLWSLRPTRPWDRCGEVSTAFELAVDPDWEAMLAEHPDVLLWQEHPEWHAVADGWLGRMGPAQVLLVGKGVCVQEVLFTEPPRVVEVRLKSLGCELRLGAYLFRGPEDLEPLARNLERWFRYAFHEFMPQVERVLTWQSPDRAAILRSWGAIPCPECRRYLLARVGQVGIALDEPVEGAGK
jgi:hypothetical protein